MPIVEDEPRGVFAVVGDSGPKNKFGEGSIALHQYLAFGELHPAPFYEPTEATARHPHAEQIFHPFYRSRSSATRAEGFGIGLTVCRRLVEAQGGRIWAAPRNGGGSEFGFTLPVTEDEPIET